MTITPEEIARLRALEAKATPGPWREDDQQLECDAGRFAIVWPTNDDCAVWRKPDLALVIESRNALPGLLDEIERLRADLREAVALLRTDSVNGDTFFAWRDRRDALLAKHKEEA